MEDVVQPITPNSHNRILRWNTPTDDQFDGYSETIPTTPLKASPFPMSQSPIRQYSPQKLESPLKTDSLAFPPARIQENFKKPVIPSQFTPRTIMKSITGIDHADRTPKKIISSITSETPNNVTFEEEKSEMDDDFLSRPRASFGNDRFDGMDAEKLALIVNRLAKEVQYLEDVKGALEEVLRDTGRDKERIVEMADTISKSDKQLLSCLLYTSPSPRDA
eukprot:TRINITY_DN4618_c0_g2_i1.p1 TRINITY_DN4618_c0_g2~~TRINITY_DN4618_c0_g2_i1.p1  ORF type:complete len:220 (+),score=45.42 TRINITY_DN4618_c0_g2_i1:54-713(+)